MKRTLFIGFMLLFLSCFVGEGLGVRCFAQFLGGNTDGHSLVSKTDVAICTLPAYLTSIVGAGGNADGHSLVSKTDVAVCTLPAYLTSTVGTGGNTDGHALASKTDVAICTLPAYQTSVVGRGGNADGNSLCADGGCYFVLPVELLSFTATLQSNNTVLCQWKTASEINNDCFTVEKTKNAFQYEVVGKVKGAGNSITILNYSMIDQNPYSGISYYRLKQTDYDGKYSYSGIVPVYIGTVNIINVYPNPSEEEIKALIAVPESTEATIEIINTLGEQIIFRKEYLKKGTTEIVINTEVLAQGGYIVKVTLPDKENTRKMFVK